MKKICFLFLLLLFPTNNIIKAKTSCDYTLLSNLKKIVNNVNVSYTYYIDDDVAFFDVTLTNITDDIYFYDKYNKKYYYYGDTDNGVITLNGYNSGNVNFYFYSNYKDCYNEKLQSKLVNLPYYNKFYNDYHCEGIFEFSLCQKWTKFGGEYDDFVNKVNDYRLSLEEENFDDIDIITLNWFDKIINFFTNYYYILLPVVIIIFVFIMYLIKYVKNRINRFDI